MSIIEISRKEFDNLDFVKDQLDKLACAFYVTGNTAIGDKLHSLANSINNSKISLSQALDTELDDKYKHQVETSANILSAALAGIEIAKK